jgi:hypothetical protein
MSYTAYQTAARPRGRRDLDSVDAQQQPSSRTSSHASQRLAKTTSRTLEEPPPKSRGNSPALFWQRNKAADPSGPRDSINISPKGTTTPAAEHNKTSIAVATPPQREETSPSRKRDSMPPSAAANYFKTKTAEPTGVKRSHSRSRTRSLTHSMIARMQPSVADASEEDSSSKHSERARSSATSLNLSSLNGSDLGGMGEKVAKVETEPSNATATAANEEIGAPLKYTYSTPNMSSITTPRVSPPPRPVDTAYTTVPQQQYQYAPPGAFPSPRQITIDTPTPVPQPVHTTVSPAISPPHSPRLHQQPNYPPPPAPYYGYPPQMNPAQHMQFSYYPPPPTDPLHPQYMPSPALTQLDMTRSISSTGSTTAGLEQAEPQMNPTDLHQRDWHKITSVLPELNRILSHYEEQKSQSQSSTGTTNSNAPVGGAVAEGESLATKDSFSRQLDFRRTQEMARLRVELDANKTEYEKVIARLVAEAYALKQDLSDKIAAAETARSENELLQRQNEELVGGKAEVEGKLSGATGQLETLLRANSTLEARDEEHRAEMVALQRQLQELGGVKGTLEAELEARRSAEAELTTELQTQRTHCEELAGQVLQWEAEATSWRAKHADAAAALDQTRLTTESLHARNVQLEDVRRRLEARESELGAKVGALRKEHEHARLAHERTLDGQKALLAASQAEVAALAERRRKDVAEVEGLRGEVGRLERRCEAHLEAQRVAKGDRDRLVEEGRREVGAVRADMDRAVQQREAVAKELQGRIGELEAVIAGLREEVGAAKASTEHLKSEVIGLTGTLSAKEEELATLRNELGLVKTELHTEKQREGSAMEHERRSAETLASLLAWRKKRDDAWRAEETMLEGVLAGLRQSASSMSEGAEDNAAAERPADGTTVGRDDKVGAPATTTDDASRK